MRQITCRIFYISISSGYKTNIEKTKNSVHSKEKINLKCYTINKKVISSYQIMKLWIKYILAILFLVFINTTESVWASPVESPSNQQETQYNDEDTKQSEEIIYMISTFRLDKFLTSQNQPTIRIPSTEIRLRTQINEDSFINKILQLINYKNVEFTHRQHYSLRQSAGHYIYMLRKIII